MGFGDLKKAAGLSALNEYLADRSFIEGYTVSQADVVVFQALSGAPAADLFNALRWYRQVNSYKSQFSSLPGVKKDVSEYGSSAATTPATANAADAGGAEDEDDDDMDLFGSDDDDDEDALAAIQASRKAAEDKAALTKKPKPLAKSSIFLDVKPWDDETDMKEVEKLVRGIKMDGLLWGASKLVAVGYGIKKLQICCVVEDDKVGTDDLEESITKFELVQSMDIAAFNKI